MSFPCPNYGTGKPLPPLTLRGVLWAWIKSFFVASAQGEQK